MPLYEYRCKECDHLEEVLQKVSDPAPATCPACGKEHTMAKEVSLTSFQLKGGGWYKDLYSSVPADKKDGAKKSEGSEAKAGAKSEGKSTDSKTTAKESSSSSSSSTSASSASSSSSAASPSSSKPSGSSPKAA